MSANKVFRGPLWAALVGALVAAIVVSFLVFVQSGEAAPPATADKQQPPREASITPWILGGTEVPNGKYPFMAFLDFAVKGQSVGFCGGTLIDRDSVLTAAHCFFNNRGFPRTEAAVVVGVTDLRQRNQGQVRGIRPTVYVHPRYKHPKPNSPPRYDAAVLNLSRPVKGIKPLKLATASQNNLEAPGRNLSVAGWGVTRAKGAPVTHMREVSVPVISDSRAERGYDAFYGSPSGYVPPLMIAAGKQGKSACVGDSGGPLFDSGSRTQVGIVSGGRYKCGTARYPGIYTEVNNPKIRNWILSVAKR